LLFEGKEDCTDAEAEVIFATNLTLGEKIAGLQVLRRGTLSERQAALQVLRRGSDELGTICASARTSRACLAVSQKFWRMVFDSERIAGPFRTSRTLQLGTVYTLV
jgi:hypothetical protein